MKENTELYLTTTEEYRSLRRDRVLLASIREGKDYNWIQEQYKLIDVDIKNNTVLINLDEEKDNNENS